MDLSVSMRQNQIGRITLIQYMIKMETKFMIDQKDIITLGIIDKKIML